MSSEARPNLKPFGFPLGLAGIEVLVATVEQQTLVRTLASWLLALCLVAMGRTAIQVFLGGYICWRPGRISDDAVRHARTRLNLNVALNTAVVALGIVGAAALWMNPDAPFLCKLLPEFALSLALFVTAASTAAWVGPSGLDTGTTIVERTRLGGWLRRLGELEYDLGSDGPTFAPLRPVYEFFKESRGNGRASALALAVSLLILAAPVAETTAQVHRKGKEAVEGFFGPGEKEEDSSGQDIAPGRDCTTEDRAGARAPFPQRSDLRALWHGRKARPGVEAVNGFGAPVAGCPSRRASSVNSSQVWVQRGFCGRELRGLGVAVPDRPPAMLLQQAAKFGDREAKAGRLLGASTRGDVGAGDAYVIDSAIPGVGVGSYVLLRGEKTGGPTKDSQGGRFCGPLRDSNVPYTVTPPGLLPLWREVLIAKGTSWPHDGGTHFPKGKGFSFYESAVPRLAGKPLATATCLDSSNCTLTIDGQKRTTTETRADPRLTTTLTEVRALATGEGP